MGKEDDYVCTMIQEALIVEGSSVSLLFVVFYPLSIYFVDGSKMTVQDL